jgi:PAS domain S-box-containing protein
MNKNDKRPAEVPALRQKAEEVLKAKPVLQASEADTLKLIHELQVHQIELEMQNEELVRAKATALAAMEKYSDLYDFAPSGYFTLSRDGVIVELNLRGSSLLGRERERLKNSSFCFFIAEGQKQVFNQLLEKVFASGKEESCEVMLVTDRKVPRYVHLTGIVSADGKECFLTMVDVTLSTQNRIFEEMSRDILLILNEAGELEHLVPRILTVLKARTGLYNVGIRLQPGDEFPYTAQAGYPMEFFQTETQLGRESAVCTECAGSKGGADTDAPCNIVLSGKADAGDPLFTPGGSWWTNDSITLPDSRSGKGLASPAQKQSVHKGYATAALVPIKSGKAIIGLVQFNDRRQGCLTGYMVELLEGIASHIGLALARKLADDALKKQTEDLTRFNKAMIGRELRMVELKKQIKELKGNQ